MSDDASPTPPGDVAGAPGTVDQLSVALGLDQTHRARLDAIIAHANRELDGWLDKSFDRARAKFNGPRHTWVASNEHFPLGTERHLIERRTSVSRDILDEDGPDAPLHDRLYGMFFTICDNMASYVQMVQKVPHHHRVFVSLFVPSGGDTQGMITFVVNSESVPWDDTREART
jgi:hypothetical protein